MYELSVFNNNIYNISKNVKDNMYKYMFIKRKKIKRYSYFYVENCIFFSLYIFDSLLSDHIT